jgi:hypothetical protein
LSHDELLAKINALEETIHRELSNTLILGSATPFQALRAVVELHQSAPFKMTGNVEEIPGLLCLHCSTNLEPKDWIHYPCPTIQAIEKELNQ